MRAAALVASAVLAVAVLPMTGVEARIADTTPPVIDSVRCECLRPYAYSTIALTATAHDDESGIASVAWVFSDGLTASGTTVQRRVVEAGTLTATVTVTDGSGNVSTGGTEVEVLANPYPPEPSYSEPTLDRVRLSPGTVSASGLTPGVPRRTRLDFRVRDDFGTTAIRVLVRNARGDRVARRDLHGLREGERSVRLRARIGGVRLPPGHYRVSVRATNDYGSAESRGLTLRVVR
ncbi:PKD domain-containing protein [Nocardioides oleivorans]|uniref:PKD domain-containing protein n=1 Tax=Nocardioides oleivorans TaxID=273676 RepID=A0A4V1RLA3_9ACTN|nr:PKD domain-containing protein [Nocardioides oleivorans]RYB95082.1 PKD domain-containing protein [Nocardioides oleivorans]